MPSYKRNRSQSDYERGHSHGAKYVLGELYRNSTALEAALCSQILLRQQPSRDYDMADPIRREALASLAKILRFESDCDGDGADLGDEAAPELPEEVFKDTRPSQQRVPLIDWNDPAQVRQYHKNKKAERTARLKAQATKGTKP